MPTLSTFYISPYFRQLSLYNLQFTIPMSSSCVSEQWGSKPDYVYNCNTDGSAVGKPGIR